MTSPFLLKWLPSELHSFHSQCFSTIRNFLAAAVEVDNASGYSKSPVTYLLAVVPDVSQENLWRVPQVIG